MKRFFKYILVSFILLQTIIVNIPAYAYETFSNWNDVENYIYENMQDRNSEIKFTYKGNRLTFGKELKEVLKDTYSKDDYLERSWKEIKPEAYDTDNGIETTLNIKYLCTKQQEEYIDDELKRVTKSLVNTNMSDYDKVKTINDYIKKRYEYDYSLNSISVYSALNTSFAVCQGYSMTAYKMFNYAGIENRIVIGTAKGVSHSWNIVNIDGRWYQIDITNNDSDNADRYFLVSDQFLIYSNYIWDNKIYPTASESYNIESISEN